jgi:uncharacterized protein YkwD
MSLFHHLFLPHHTNNQRAKILHPSVLSLIIFVFAVFQISLSQVSRTLPQILGFASQIPASEIVRLTNIQRSNHNLSALKLDAKLSAAAAQKASDMFAKNYWSHVSPSGTQPWFFITQSGYSYRFAGENLARDFSDPDSVVVAWMNSASHKDNLLNTRYEDIGVAVVDGQLEGRETTLVVQMFGTKLQNIPQVSEASTSLVAKALEPSPVPTILPTPTESPSLPVAAKISTPPAVSSPFEITKYLSVGLLTIFTLVLVADVVIINRKKISRWTSKSFAHLIFVVIVLIAISTILRGKII